MLGRVTTIATVGLGVFAVAATTVVGQPDQYELFNACKPMQIWLLIDSGDEPAEPPTGGSPVQPRGHRDLSYDRLQSAVESRLRAARLFNREAAAAVLVQVWFWGETAVSIRTEFKQPIVVPGTEWHAFATMWSQGMIGPPNALVEMLSEHLDRFLTAYLRVNEPSC